MKTAEQAGKRRFWRKALAGFAAIALLLFAIHIGTNYYHERRLQTLLDQLDAEDPGWRWESVKNAQVELATKDNAAAEVVELLKLTTLRETIPLINRNAWGKAFSQLYQQHSFEYYELFLECHPNARMPASMREKMQPLMQMAPMAEVLPRARLLRQYQSGRFEHTYKPMVTLSLLPDAQGTRSITNLLAWDADLQMLAQQPVLAIESVQGMLGVARSFERDPFLISHLVRLAISGHAARQTMRLLALSASWTPEQLQTLQAEFQREHDLSATTLQIMVRNDRAALDHDLSALINGGLTVSETSKLLGRGSQFTTGSTRIDDSLINMFPELVVGWGNRPGHYKKERLELLTFFHEAVRWTHLPDHQLLSELENWKQRGSPMLTPFIRYFFLMFGFYGSGKDSIPEMEMLARLANGYLSQRARLRCIMAGLAAERYRLKEGRWPTTWEALLPGYLKDVPIDPFTGKPLIMKPLPDGLVIYSVGKDGIDHGGNVLTSEDASPRDLGFRFWNPEQRGISLDEQCIEFVKKRKAE